MPAATPQEVKRRAIELGRTLGGRGASQALAQEGITLSKSVIDGWLRQAIAGDPRAAVAAAAAGPGASPPAKPLPEARDLPEQLRGLDPAALDYAKLEELERDAKAFRETAQVEGAARTYSALARLEIEILSWKAKLRPPAVVPPDEDPDNLKAKAELRERLRRLRSDTEASAAGRAQIRAHLDALDARGSVVDEPPADRGT